MLRIWVTGSAAITSGKERTPSQAVCTKALPPTLFSSSPVSSWLSSCQVGSAFPETRETCLQHGPVPRREMMLLEEERRLCILRPRDMCGMQTLSSPKANTGTSWPFAKAFPRAQACGLLLMLPQIVTELGECSGLPLKKKKTLHIANL